MIKSPEITNFVCEYGHRVWKYFIGTGNVHRLLCPLCDTEELEKESLDVHPQERS